MGATVKERLKREMRMDSTWLPYWNMNKGVSRHDLRFGASLMPSDKTRIVLVIQDINKFDIVREQTGAKP
jgi:hypothetical protein